MKKINEGFWDSIVSGVKRGGLAAAATLGSKKADGKLSAEVLGKNLYDGFQKFIGSTGLDAEDPATMQHFLANEAGMDTGFVDNGVKLYQAFVNDPMTFFREHGKNTVASAQGDTSVEPGQQASAEPAKAADPTQAPTEKKAETSATASPVNEFMKSDGYQEFKQQVAGTAFPGNSEMTGKDYKWSSQPDGSFVYAKDVERLKSLMAENLPPAEFAAALDHGRMFTTWKAFKSLVGKPELKSGTAEEAELVMAAMTAAAKKYGKNIFHGIDRIALAVPTPGDEKVPFQVKESAQLNEASDGELRKFFVNLAQKALITGSAKKAAKASIQGVPTALKAQPGAQTAAPAAPTPEKQNTASVNAPVAAPAAPAATAPAEAPATPVKAVELGGVKLSDKEQATLNSLENQVGIEGVAGLIKTDDPEVTALAKKIMLQALRNYRAATPTKK